jgi:hypothetical protein
VESPFSEIWQEIVSRPQGPLAFRFYLQPLMAIVLAVRDGLRDAREGQPAFLWSVFTDGVSRRDFIRDGWRSIGKVFMLALTLDVVYQAVVLGGLKPIQGLLVATTLAIVPYVIVRGPVSRLAEHMRGPRATTRRRAA